MPIRTVGNREKEEMQMTIARMMIWVLALGMSSALTGCLLMSDSSSSENEEAAVNGVVRTERTAAIRYAPALGAPVLQSVPAATKLDWLANQTSNGFYRVGASKGAIGWIKIADVTIVQQHVLAGFVAEAACATTLAQCPVRGCAAAGSPDALSNTLKHHEPSGSAVLLTFDDFDSLQSQADNAVGSGLHIPVADRAALANLSVASGTVSEGSAVRLVGYLVAKGMGPHPNSSGESVNCGLTGSASNDFHIPVTSDPGRSEFEGIVVEMKPQDRPAKWTIPAMKAVQKAHRQVWIEGNLFYDGQHRVNSDSAHPMGNQPKRFSLWEIHPVTKFLVCDKPTCDSSDEADWRAL
jgi:hypothetical protein